MIRALVMKTSFSKLPFVFLTFAICIQIFGDEQKVENLIKTRAVLESKIVAPAGKVALAVQISLEPDWHIYWENSGDSGYPTTIEWSLPDGWSIGELNFPAPYLYEYEGITGYAMENNFTLLATLTAPSDLLSGESINVSGTLDALVCNASSCLPYRYTFSLEIEGGEKSLKDPSTEKVFRDAEARLPASLPSEWATSASLSGRLGEILIQGDPLSAVEKDDFVFFPKSPQIIMEYLTKPSYRMGNFLSMSWMLRDEGIQIPETLNGLLLHPSNPNGWNLDLSVDVEKPRLDNLSFKQDNKVIPSPKDHFALLRLLLACVLFAMAFWAYGRSQQPSVAVFNWQVFALFVLGSGIWLGYPRESNLQGEKLSWAPWSQQLEDELRSNGEAIFIDYTAKWCLSCQVNKRVYESESLKNIFREKKVHLLRADWTKKSPDILSSLQSHGRAGVPLNVFFPASKKEQSREAIILPEILSSELLKEALSKGHQPVAKQSMNFLTLIGFAWLGGLVLNLMPCVFPVIGLKIMGFVKQAGEHRASIARHGWVFTSGVLLSFWILVGILLIIRNGLEHNLGWGFQLQEPVFVFVLAVILFVFGLSLSGVFEIGMSATGIGSALSSRPGIVGSFFSGVLATVVATPCMAPFLGVAVGAALSMPTSLALLVFTFVAVGLSTPYLILSIFPQWIQKLPKPGIWMESLKQFMAFPVYATVAWLIWTLDGLL